VNKSVVLYEIFNICWNCVVVGVFAFFTGLIFFCNHCKKNKKKLYLVECSVITVRYWFVVYS